MEKMLVTQALNELKTLDARINREISNASLVYFAKTSEKNVTANMSKEDYNTKAKATIQSINALIARRKAIKSAIVVSNANVIVKIGDVEMTVADAIERKTSIEYEKNLLKKMKEQYGYATSMVERKNTEMEAAIERLVNTAFGKDSKTNIKPEDYSSIANPYKEQNEYSLVDPIHIVDEIAKRENELDTFLSEVDTALQISNCTVAIEF